MLRWSPVNTELFSAGLKKGYIIERITVNTEDVITSLSFNTAAKEKFSIPAPDMVPSERNNIRPYHSEMIRKYTRLSNSKEKEYMFALMLLEAGVNKQAAIVFGLYFEDTVMHHSSHYCYRISIADDPSKSILITIDAAKNDIHQPMSILTGDVRNSSVQLKWNAEILNTYSGYWIERSTDSLTFQRINPYPFIFFRSQYEINKSLASFGDTSVKEGLTYYYRIAGINHFGEEGEKSNVIPVYIPHRYNGFPVIDTVLYRSKKILVHGRVTAGNKSEIIKEVQLLGCDSIDGKYSLINSGSLSDLKFSLEDTIFSNQAFYVVRIITTESDTISSYPYYSFFNDTVPPVRPENI